MERKFEDGVWKGIVKPPMKEWRRFRSILLERLNKYPSRIGQIDAVTGHEDTFGDMADRVTRCSVWLKKQNLQSGDIIGICTYNQLNAFVPLIASFLVGAIPNPWWDYELNHDMIRHFLNLTKPKVIFCDETKIADIKKVVKETRGNIRIICLNDIAGVECLSHITETQNSDEVSKFECEDLKDLKEPAIIVYTSGTTGYPKGAVLPYGRFVPYILPISEKPEIYYLPARISWVSGLMNIFQNIASCSTTVIYSNLNMSRDEKIVLEIIEKYKVKIILGINTAYAIRIWKNQHLLTHDLSSIERISFSGSAMVPEADEFTRNLFKNAMVINRYACTEVGILCHRFGWTGKPSSCGYVEANVQLRVVDVDSGKVLGPNQEGELCVKHPYIMLRYHNNPEATKEVFDDEGWYHTGDLAYYDDDGEFFVVDRLKEFIRFRISYAVASPLIENVILSHPAVLDAAVIGKPHDDDIEQPMAFISLCPNAKGTANEIIDFVAKHVPDHMQLRGGVVILSDLPRTNSGKIMKKELRQKMKSLIENDI